MSLRVCSALQGALEERVPAGLRPPLRAAAIARVSSGFARKCGCCKAAQQVVGSKWGRGGGADLDDVGVSGTGCDVNALRCCRAGACAKLDCGQWWSMKAAAIATCEVEGCEPPGARGVDAEGRRERAAAADITGRISRKAGRGGCRRHDTTPTSRPGAIVEEEGDARGEGCKHAEVQRRAAADGRDLLRQT
jgi:hypothetical protein